MLDLIQQLESESKKQVSILSIKLSTKPAGDHIKSLWILYYQVPISASHHRQGFPKLALSVVIQVSCILLFLIFIELCGPAIVLVLIVYDRK